MKKLFKGFVAGAAALSVAATAMGATFSDVEGTAYEWAQSYIEDMAEKGLISGYEDGTFKPEKTVSKIEAISLFARAMGSRSELNAAVVEHALAEYGELIDTYSLNFGEEDVAFMLYRGALTEAEATAYLSGDTKNEPMLRYEAATIITKAMGGEAEAKRNLVLDLEYTDVSDIPSAAKKYVYYVSEKSIMSGMGDGTFSPNTSVLRSQIAVMLSKTVEAMDITFSEVTLTAVDTEALSLSVTDPDGEAYELGYTEDTSFYLEGEEVQAKNIPAGVNAVITLNADGVLYVDVESAVPDETITAIFNSYQNKNGVLSIVATAPNSSESTTYECVSGISDITKNGEKSSVINLSVGDYLEIKTSKGKVVSISAIDKTTTIKAATIEAISYDGSNPTITISHSNEEYDGLELQVSGSVSVMKDGASVNMTEVYRGDKVTLTLEYGVVEHVVANSLKLTSEGTIRSINISANPTITVLVKGEEVVYDVTNNIKITVNGEDATLYDFRVGDKVTLTTESNAVTKIESVTTQATEGNLSGTVISVNSSYQFIKLLVTDSTGNTYEENVYCKDTKTTFITAAGSTKQLRDITAGNVLSVYGTYSNGAFEATSVIIVK
ncbi:MAG: S-layer homology domain-containing protein [Clostridia bacterium]|nr:S-layer homology domain-containing protein [Clostridia bacterium]